MTFAIPVQCSLLQALFPPLLKWCLYKLQDGEGGAHDRLHRHSLIRSQIFSFTCVGTSGRCIVFVSCWNTCFISGKLNCPMFLNVFDSHKMILKTYREHRMYSRIQSSLVITSTALIDIDSLLSILLYVQSLYECCFWVVVSREQTCVIRCDISPRRPCGYANILDVRCGFFALD